MAPILTGDPPAAGERGINALAETIVKWHPFYAFAASGYAAAQPLKCLQRCPQLFAHVQRRFRNLIGMNMTPLSARRGHESSEFTNTFLRKGDR